jgi:hypothetical protein
MSMTDMAGSPDRGRPWVKRLGMIGFCFFLIKGLAWLTVPLLLWLSAIE